MSTWETVPSDDEFESETEREEYMLDVYRDLRDHYQERKHHNRDGYFAQLAGSAECEALGHKPHPEYGWDDDADEHPWGFDEILCEATRYGECCTECEGECSIDLVDPSTLWKAVSA